MAIDNVTSTLPDKLYIAALENKLAGMEADLNRVLGDVQNLQRGRS